MSIRLKITEHLIDFFVSVFFLFLLICHFADVAAVGITMDEVNGNGKRGLPKLREILRRQKPDSEVLIIRLIFWTVTYFLSNFTSQDEETPDIDFNYEDADCQPSEIAELYSYTEGPEFQAEQKAFQEACQKFDLPNTWRYVKQSGRKETLYLRRKRVLH